MTEVLRLAAIGIVGAILAVTVQQQKKELALVLTVAAGALLLWEASQYLQKILEGLKQMAAEAGLASDHIKLLLKLMAISYVVEFGSEVCKDAGQQSLAAKIQLGGKLMMAALALPIFQSLMEVVTELLI